MTAPLGQLLAQQDVLFAPGVYDALSALLVERAGFEAAYLSGASIAYTQLGRPDIGLVGFDQVADVLGRICERVSIPIVVDADTGWGNALNVERVVRLFERAGASAIQLEDQTFPKRCGHLDGKRLIATAEMAEKIRSACDARRSAETLIIARTDAMTVTGFDDAMERAESYLEAGADLLFVEAPRDIGEMEACCARLARQAPLVANMVEGGHTPILSAGELGAMGFRLVIAPGALVRALTFTAERFLDSVRDHGATAGWRDRMLNLAGLNARLGLNGPAEHAIRCAQEPGPAQRATDRPRPERNPSPKQV